jgi:restriction system protein
LKDVSSIEEGSNMAKKKKKKPQSFAYGHLLFTLLCLPFIIPVMIVKAILNARKKRAQKNIEDMTGQEYERYVADKLLRRGFRKAEVTKASGDFGADIIATDAHGRKVCIQCKKYKKNVGVKAVQEVIAASKYYGCDSGMVITTAQFTAAAKKMAAQTDVKLEENFI